MIKMKKILFTSILLAAGLSLTGCATGSLQVHTKASVQKDVDIMAGIVKEVSSAKQMDFITVLMGYELESTGIDIPENIKLEEHFILDTVITEQEEKVKEINDLSMKKAAENFLESSKETTDILNKGLSKELTKTDFTNQMSDKVNGDIQAIAENKKLANKISEVTQRFGVDFQSTIQEVIDNMNNYTLEKYSSKIENISQEIMGEFVGDLFGDTSKTELEGELDSKKDNLNVNSGSSSLDKNQSSTNSTSSSSDEVALKEFAKATKLDIGHWSDEKDHITTTDEFYDKKGIEISAMADDGIVDYVSISLNENGNDTEKRTILKEKFNLMDSYFGVDNGAISKAVSDIYNQISNKSYLNTEDGKKQSVEGYLFGEREIKVGSKDILIDLMIHDYEKSLTDTVSITIFVYE